MKIAQKKSRIVLRKATDSDKEDVLNWRNDLGTRANSFNQDMITETEHEQWFSKSLQDHNRLILIGHFQNKKIGVIRYDRIKSEHYEVNVILAPSLRGMGLGTAMIKQSLSWVKGRVMARVKKGNLASIQAFENAGYKLVQEQQGTLILETAV